MFSQAPPKVEQQSDIPLNGQKIEVKELFPRKMPNGPQGEQVFLLQSVTDNSKNEENETNNNGLFGNPSSSGQNIFGNNKNNSGNSSIFSMSKPVEEEAE